MPLPLDEFRCKLINKILFATSQKEVIRYCEAAIKGLEHHQVNGHIMARFADKMISELDQFNPMNKNAQQWSNILMAKNQFNDIKQKINTLAD